MFTIHPAGLDDATLTQQCQVHYGRTSGPGGQHRNKVQTAVRLTHPATGITVQATERRSQHENLQAALRRLRLRLALEVRTATGLSQPPSERWRSRCLQGHIKINPRHDDFPALLAEALDALAAAAWEVGSAAEHLACSSSQLVRLLKREPKALALVNQQRSTSDLQRLR